MTANHGPGRVPGVRRVTDAIDRLDARDGAQEARTGREGSGMGVDGLDALRSVLAPLPADPSKLARAILADPGPLLAALAEAGVLAVEARHDGTGEREVFLADDVSVRMFTGRIEKRRYVTEWTRHA